MRFYPIYFEPIYKRYIWGAESWEISDRKEGMSIVANGAFRGRTLHELIERFGEELLGKDRQDSLFPLLIKLIDAKDDLSIQVHPDDTAAEILQAEAKTEMWYLLKAQKEAAVYAGFKPKVDRTLFEQAVRENRVIDLLEKISVQEGDSIFIPGGTVHAILRGCFLLEVQQNSNTTYRIYDWGRDRPIHIQEALQAINWTHKLLHPATYFEMQNIETNQVWQAETSGKSFQIFFVLKGTVAFIADGYEERALVGRAYLIPAACKNVQVIPQEGTSQFLRITL